ncbi:cytochrome o ubiquinol oxidase subunit IV [Larsenimonas rhizosphaerae]|uniref:Cytochrome bo(3) ubiquinol oxidase subunit 4 n=1 Tax=Larsenimonas rhizosphaerae TaxID=2944682 RepID=A0AA41ZF64_9GAMM|nr:cytochrome o ubiquinol oxidase subunit IV [Larsenimonas rhizosphaerae]MCX2522768.1 cytochrome o ubiquinol oxidase subunit IV [Larsenimonas rhizosphaerae]
MTTRQTTGNEASPEDRAQAQRREFRSYVIGGVLALILTLIPFALVAFTHLPPIATWIVIGECAIIQVVVHFRFFLHITLARNTREDLQLILFTFLILLIMVGGTLWILFNLYYRMMPDMVP